MEEKLLRIVHDNFPESNIDSDNWRSVLKSCTTVPSIFHLLNTVHYYIAYFSKESAVNLSTVLYDNKQAVGVMPLMAHKNEQSGWVLSSNGVEIVEPIFSQSLARKVKKRLEAQLFNLISDLSKQLNIRQCQFVNIGCSELSSWYVMCAERAKEVFSTHHLLVDLSLNLEDIRLKFRKSFKPLINKGLREWQVEVHEQVTSELFERFRLLHKSVSGGSTRTIESWDKQKEQIDSMESFIVTVSDEDNVLIGVGLFTYSRYSSLYCVGAYKRELFDKPLGHAVQMKAIETFKNNGLKWYEIGQKHLKIDKIPATEKELSISHFKEGFATHIVARQHLVVDITYD
jgi:FemAB family protein